MTSDAFSWPTVKKTLAASISSLVEQQDFRRVGRTAMWARKCDDVYQLISFEKMRSSNVRVRVFVETEQGVQIGGNLTKTTIAGGGVAGPDYFWSIRDGSAAHEACVDIGCTLSRFALPWFDVFRRSDVVEKAIREYPQHSRYGLDIARVSSTAKGVARAEDNKRWLSKEMLANCVHKKCGRELLLRSFEVITSGQTYLRDRGEVCDVIQILPFNHGTQIQCLAFNWVPKLSPSGDGKFREDGVVALVGGQVKDPNSDDERLLAFDVTTDENLVSACLELCELLSDRSIPELESTCSYAIFSSKARRKYPLIAETFEI